MNLENLGWHDFFENQVEDTNHVGRVIFHAQNHYTFMTTDGVKTGQITGNMTRHQEFPRIGDFISYVVSDDGSFNSIVKVLTRHTCLIRKEAGLKSDDQVIAANIDYVFLVMSLNEDFNLRRLERYLVGAWESGATPVVILTKKDICDDLEEKMLLIESIAFGIDIQAVSAIENDGIKRLETYFEPGKTIALIGSSGVGKSTLINTILGEEVMKTDGLRNDDRGHHTTTHREMIITDHCLLIDTPGMREFGMTDSIEGIKSEFEDIENLSKTCKFSDCKHDDEPGCAVRQAIENGTLEANRFRNYQQLLRESRHQERKRRHQEKVQAQKIEKSKRKQKPRVKKWSSAYD